MRLVCGVLGVLAVACAVGACGGDDERDEGLALAGDDGTGPADPPEVLSKTIGPEGGTIEAAPTSALAGFRLVIPPGALAAPTALTVKAVIDPVPLGAQAERVGPQFSIEPAGVAFAAPASLTVPYDLALRESWDVPDTECRVWFRDGAGWKNAAQTASDELSVTVPLSATTTVAAGVVRSFLPPKCSFNCTAPAAPASNCRDGARFCLTRLAALHEPTFSGYFSYTQGTLYWVTAPEPNTFALASFDVLGRKALPTTARVMNASGANATGEVIVDGAGARWLTVRRFGTVRFEGAGAPTRFDASSSTPALGVGLDKATRQAIRFRYALTTRNIGGAQSAAVISGVLGTQTRYLATLVGGSLNTSPPDEVAQIGRSLSSDLGYAVRARTWGVASITGAHKKAEVFFFFNAGNCGGRIRSSSSQLVPSPDRAIAELCSTASPFQRFLQESSPNPRTIATAPGAGKWALDGRGTAWYTSLVTASITRFTPDGGVAEIPLSSAASGTPEYTAMIPISIHYELGTDTLLLVTRGAGDVPEIHEVTNLR